MRVSELLNEGVKQFLENLPSMQDHMADTQNPHAVTKEDVGLSKVTNDLQAKDTDFRSHKHAAILDHPAGSVTAEKLASFSVTEEKLAKGAVGGDALKKGCVTEAHLDEPLRTKISEKVDKEDGMGLSKNSFTDAEKNKLALLTLSEGDTLTVDTSAMLLKSEPLRLIETGKEYRMGEEETLAQNVSAFRDAGSYQDGDVITFSYMDRDDNYCIAYGFSGMEGFRVLNAPENIASYAVVDREIFFGRIMDGYLEVWSAPLSGIGNEGLTLCREVPLTAGENAVLRHLFVKSWPDTPGTAAGARKIVTAVYFSGDHSRLYVDTFCDSGTANPPIAWSFSVDSEPLASYATNYTGTVYNDALPVAAMDAGGNLYIAPVESTEEPYSALRLSPEGEVTKRYRPLPKTKNESHVLQGICVLGETLYGFYEKGQVYAFHTESGIYRRVLSGSVTGAEKLAGLSPDADGYVHYLARKADGSGMVLRCTDGKREAYAQENSGALCAAAHVSANAALCIAHDGISLFRFDKASATIRRKLHTLMTVYQVQ